MSASGAETPEADMNPSTSAPQVYTVEQGAGVSQVSMKPVKVSIPIPTNIFTRILQGTFGFTTTNIRVLVEDGYDTK